MKKSTESRAHFALDRSLIMSPNKRSFDNIPGIEETAAVPEANTISAPPTCDNLLDAMSDLRATSSPSLTHWGAHRAIHCSSANSKPDSHSARSKEFLDSSRTSQAGTNYLENIDAVFFLTSFCYWFSINLVAAIMMIYSLSYICRIQTGRFRFSLEPEMLVKACIYASFAATLMYGNWDAGFEFFQRWSGGFIDVDQWHGLADFTNIGVARAT